ncbi:hypothetical protein ACMGE6_01995 [Macrococcus equi]|uniref:hypothetical protein n=1 Tax=Macrococcus equi TaxID=3395462 RepID=UPI0039BE69C5
MTKNLYINMLIYGSVFILFIILYNLFFFPKHSLISWYFLVCVLIAMATVWPETKIKQTMAVDKINGLRLKKYYYLRYIFIYLGILISGIIIYIITKSDEAYTNGLFTWLCAWGGTTIGTFFRWMASKEELNQLINKNNNPINEE